MGLAKWPRLTTSVSGWRAERSEAKPVRLNANVSLAGGEKTTVGQPGQRPPPTLKRLPDLQGLSRPPDTNNSPPRADAGLMPTWILPRCQPTHHRPPGQSIPFLLAPLATLRAFFVRPALEGPRLNPRATRTKPLRGSQGQPGGLRICSSGVVLRASSQRAPDTNNPRPRADA